MPDVQRYLREEELGQQVFLIQSRQMGKTQLIKYVDLLRERLAEERERSEARRALLEKYQYKYRAEPGVNECICCGGWEKTTGCTPDCAIAAQLAGTRGGK